MKRVHVLLAFHAHEPLWDLPIQLARASRDPAIADAVGGENWIRRRAKEGRDIYKQLVRFCEALKLPATLDITNETLFQLGRETPGTIAELKGAYAKGLLQPLYIPAHHTHAALLQPEELIDEIRLNEEYLHEILGAPRPRRRGLFFTECSIDSSFLPAVEEYGIDYLVVPDLDPRRANFAVEAGAAPPVYVPFPIGRHMVALPRHFPVSQYIWRPLTRWKPEKAKYQGFLVGTYPVFSEEYRSGRSLDVPIDRGKAIAEYTEVLRRAVAEAPDGGLILYLQDLELMDFGDLALEVLEESISRVRGERLAEVVFTTADQYLDGAPRLGPRVHLDRISWAPEIRVLLRADGQYPPIDAGPFRGYDASQIFRQRPFIYWDGGIFHARLFEWLLRAFDYPLVAPVSAKLLDDEDYRIDRFPFRARLPMHLRLMKRACNWGWSPDEGRAKRPYLNGHAMADCLLLELDLAGGRLPAATKPLPVNLFEGLERMLEAVIDPRIDYLHHGYLRQREERGIDTRGAFQELEKAKLYRAEAAESARAASIAHAKIRARAGLPAFRELLTQVRAHCRAAFLALDRIQRAWGAGGNVDELVVSMYRYLFELYPPKLPGILDALGA